MEITTQEKDLLLEVIETDEETTIQGIDHADTRDFKDALRNRLALLASLRAKLQKEAQP